jgi:hypothetical protein
MPIRLRAAEARDFDDVRAMAEAFHAEDGHPIDAKAEAAALVFGLGEGDLRGWLVVEEGRTVGYVAAAMFRRDRRGGACRDR